MNDHDPVLRVEDIMQEYRVSRSTAYRVIREHGFRIGTSLRIRQSTLRTAIGDVPAQPGGPGPRSAREYGRDPIWTEPRGRPAPLEIERERAAAARERGDIARAERIERRIRARERQC